MADANNSTYMIRGVEALYPRINSTYRFDSTAGTKGKSVPCEPTDENARYELSFRMNKDQAMGLVKAMSEAYKAGREKSWPAKLDMPFVKDEGGMYVGKTILKGAYNGQATTKPLQVDAKNKELPAKFKLTTGSTINIQVSFFAYNMRDHGVSIRVRAVQVINLVEQDAYSPFDIEEGFTIDADPVTGFEEVEDAVVVPIVAVVPEPEIKPKKKEAATPKDGSLDDLIEGWED